MSSFNEIKQRIIETGEYPREAVDLPDAERILLHGLYATMYKARIDEVKRSGDPLWSLVDAVERVATALESASRR